MLLWQTQLANQLQELHLIQCSLLPGERLEFVLPEEDLAIWTSLLDAFTDAGFDDDQDNVITSLTHPPCQARFEIRVVGAQTWFEIALPRCTDPTNSASGVHPATSITISVKGEHISRDAHERWHAEIRARTAEIDEACAFPAYELLTHLTASLQQSKALSPSPAATATISSSPAPTSTPTPEPPYHALLTSHHLVSPTKRRTMHHLASHLGITGFAKVGYPGVIYAQGSREAVEAFVDEVKRMQWFALRMRFIEPVSVSRSVSGSNMDAESRVTPDHSVGWVEVSKVGEVVEWMRMRGIEALVTDLGIGAPSKESRNDNMSMRGRK